MLMLNEFISLREMIWQKSTPPWFEIVAFTVFR
jgi:hypothetical protein